MVMHNNNLPKLGPMRRRADSLALAAVEHKGVPVLESFSSSAPGMATAESLWRPLQYSTAMLAKGSLAFTEEKATRHLMYRQRNNPTKWNRLF
ncbi:MAG: hypothetical protein QM642_03245 [Edaphocola sp.]